MSMIDTFQIDSGFVTPLATAPIAMTNYNLSQTQHGVLIDKGLPLVDDGQCGVPLVTESCPDNAFSLDITNITSQGLTPL